ncbi:MULTISPECIES: outer membrane protein [unclassified Bartonella]|uniref:outer membrane protein n=1 Tax=unclassified Bartonella TaxID=2645622 RepID=UPI0009C24941|nr:MULTISPECIES: outer membrane beta-barrel protein [unclassified Bartonella]AQX23213.1 Outer membrane protein beta-barrel domain-containing protein [Bartonella sp. 11B]AQX23485.1 Outer membrane protein beta-barrel domain-containing protein [Bartonella sp. 114]AQX25671.1 Outer membrane protein beta-barrel domain-containing protein [Bartonella sp. Coyote22sub2]
MNIRYLITVSVLSLNLPFGAQAGDTAVPSGLKSIASPFYSWDGFYLGGQVGSFSSSMSLLHNNTGKTDERNLKGVFSSGVSGITGGFYAGVNFEYSNRFVLGVDTDIVFSNKKAEKVFVDEKFENLVRSQDSIRQATQQSTRQTTGADPLIRTVLTYPNEGKTVVYDGDAALRVKVPGSGSGQPLVETSVTYPSLGKTVVYYGEQAGDDPSSASSTGVLPLPFEVYTHTLKRKWLGATRMRLGLSAGRVMPYIAGGIAYAKVQFVSSKTVNIGASKNTVPMSSLDSAEVEVMVGYTLGGGFDFAMTDRILLRAEYRYSDFGAEKFKKVDLKCYKVSDFRIGLAYKF